jgi:large subunit ribosomal protein L24
MRKIRKNDIVTVLKGKDKGQTGQVDRVFPGKNCAIVKGLRLMKKTQKPNPQKEIAGGIITREAPISLANLALINPETQKKGRVGIKIEEGKRIRYFKSSRRLIDTTNSNE